jgi:hypothetical protein
LINDGCGEYGYDNITSSNLETINWPNTLAKNILQEFYSPNFSEEDGLEFVVVLTGN